MPNLKAIAQLLSKIRWGGVILPPPPPPPPRLNYGHTDTPVKLGLRREIFLHVFNIGAKLHLIAQY